MPKRQFCKQILTANEPMKMLSMDIEWPSNLLMRKNILLLSYDNYPNIEQ